MDAPKCRLCGERHWLSCPTLAFTAPARLVTTRVTVSPKTIRDVNLLHVAEEATQESRGGVEGHARTCDAPAAALRSRDTSRTLARSAERNRVRKAAGVEPGPRDDAPSYKNYRDPAKRREDVKLAMRAYRKRKREKMS